MNKKQIIDECNIIIKNKNRFDKSTKKFKKTYPEAEVYCYFYKRIKGNIFIEKYNNKSAFFKPECIKIENENLIIECEKWSLNCWSCGSLNKIKLLNFEKNFIEIDKKYILEQCKEDKKRYLKSIKQLEKVTLEKLNNINIDEQVR